MKKRLLTIVLIMSLTLMITCLSACSEKEQTDEASGSGAGTQTEEVAGVTEAGEDNADEAPEQNDEEVTSY